MMTDVFSSMPLWLATALLIALAFALRAGGFVLARFVRDGSFAARFLKRAPGNLFVAFITVGIIAGGVPTLAGVAAALVAALLLRQEIITLMVGAGAVTLASYLM